MDVPKDKEKTVDLLSMLEKRLANPIINPVVKTFKNFSRQCFGKSFLGEFPLLDHPCIILIILASGGVAPRDLAQLEATCKFFKNPANILPHNLLSLPELAALDMCNNRYFFKSMKIEEQNNLKQKCGGSWKLVLKFLLAGEEACPRREKSQVAAGCGHSVVVSSKGVAYSFGRNDFGQLGHDTIVNEPHPRQISSLEGIRVVHSVAKYGKTILVSNRGQVYSFGADSFGESQHGTQSSDKFSFIPELVEPLKNIFVIQVAFGHFFTAVLSREGRVYTLSWGKEDKLVHLTEPNDLEPRPLDGVLENIPVVQISAGYCYLLALAFQPSGMSVYSVGCGLGGKLGQGSKEHEPRARLVENLRALNINPVIVTAGSWHIAMVARDGRVCTWGWGSNGCLGHGNEDNVTAPKVVEGLSHIKAVHVAAGNYTTFVVADDGDVYSFGYSEFSLGHGANVAEGEGGQTSVLVPKLASSFKSIKNRIVQISPTKSYLDEGHSLVLTESGKLYALGWNETGQLGVKLGQDQKKAMIPELVDINLS